MELHLKIAGILLILLALLHTIFPKYFKWKEDLRPLSLINRQMMYMHAFFIAFIVLLMGILMTSSADEIAGTQMGKQIALGLGIFWSARLIAQFIGYTPALWKGRVFETAVHVFFSLLWTYFSAVFLLTYFVK